MAEGYVRGDPLFVGLTRPPMIFGVTYMYFVMNLLGSMMYFVASSDFKVVIVAGFLHGTSYIICQKEPLLIDMFIMRQSNFMKCKNMSYHKYKSSYDPF
jgi:type IV secretion system protein VirB3